MTGSFGFGAAGTSPPDIRVQNHGTLYLLFPASDAGEEWLRAHTATDATWWGRALVVEPRYVRDIIAGAQADGLVVA